MGFPRFAVAVVVLILAGCGHRGDTVNRAPLSAEQGTRLAELENGLPYDGCTWAVHVGDETYGPDAESVTRIEAFTGGAIGRTPALITFALTGKETTLECGWGSTRPAREISISAIAPPR